MKLAERTLDELEILFDSLKIGQRIKVGFMFKDTSVILPIKFTLKKVDYSCSLSVAGITPYLRIDPDCVIEIEENIIWLGNCGTSPLDTGGNLVFEGDEYFRIEISIPEI